jgi:uncharacterized membrane protein YkvI
MKAQKMLIVWQVAFTYLGALIGAGFASGQELLKFFAVFGFKGIMGAAFSGLLFGFLGMLVIGIVVRGEIASYNQLLVYLFGKKTAVFFDSLITLFLFFSLAVMLAAGSSLGNQLWGFPLWLGYFLLAAVIYLTLLADLKGVLWLNTAIMPGLILLALAIAVLSLLSGKTIAVMTAMMMPEGTVPVVTAVISGLNLVGENWLQALVLYVSYNFILGMVLLSSLGEMVSKGGRGGVLLGGIIMGLLAAVISFSLVKQSALITNEAIPLLVLASRVHHLAGWAYSLGLWAAILTTALTLGFGLLKRVQKLLTLPKTLCLLLIFLPTLPFYSWSFAQMVVVIYPLMGYLGLVLLLALLWQVSYNFFKEGG